MFNATHFSYDGVYSGLYGLLIASFDSDTVDNTFAFAPTVKTVKSAKRNRFSFAGIEYEETPEFAFSVICPDVIPDILRREILTWLVGRKGFKRLQIHQPDYDGYEYNCIFSGAEIIYVNGNCHGFNLTATFDSPYCYGKPKKQRIKGNGDEIRIKVINESDIIDDYVYPIVKFSVKAPFIDGGVQKEISIINLNDPADPSGIRAFEFSGLFENDIITHLDDVTVDNELKIITKSAHGDNAIIPGADLLSRFNKNWLRFKRGVNELKIRINGEIYIETPAYILIGF